MDKNQNQLRLLKYTLNYIIKVPKVGSILIQLKYKKNSKNNLLQFRCLKKPLHSEDPMAKTIGLAKIAEKFEKYDSIDEFLDDINCLVRSYSIHFSRK